MAMRYARLLATLDSRGVESEQLLGADPHITADLLRGPFWFKPRGSVEIANLDRQAQYLTALLNTLPNLMRVSPMVQAIFSTPQAAKSLVEQLLRVARWPDKQAFLGSESKAALRDQGYQQQLAQHPVMQLMLQMAAAGPGGAAPAVPGQPSMPTQPSAESGQMPMMPSMGGGMPT